MTLHDLFLVSPEAAMAALGLVVLLVDIIVPRRGVAAIVAFVGLVVPLALTVALFGSLEPDGAVENTGVFANSLSLDRFSLFFKFFFIGVVAIVILMSTDYVRKFDTFRAEFYSLLLFSTTGMMLMASTRDLISIYISLELSALPLAAMAAFLRDGRSSESGMKFLVLSGVSSALLLYGMVLLYGFTGTVQLDEIAMRLGQIDLSAEEPFGSYALLAAVVLMIAGFGFKIAAFPFHMWAPDVYEGAPTPVTAFLSVASKAAGFAVILRVFYVAFSLDVLSVEWSTIFAVLSVASMTIGNLVAIAQSNIKRMLAYSTIAHAGYILVGLASVTARTGDDSVLGPASVLFYLSGYAVMNLAAFAAIIAITNRINSDHIDDFAGMGRRAPYLAAVLTFALISLTGIPPTVGFVGKLFLFSAAIEADLAWLVLAGVLNSVVGAYYYLRVVKAMYFTAPPQGAEQVPSALPMRAALLVTAAGVLAFGIYPAWLMDAARSAVALLLPA
ncbi:MAG: NADH-quinone oxidoreductase subunit N [SAR202 cluster bacterium]|nr:NADH-quinone oxidoreductase subunit N [SAR202 cluster bacterium]